MAFPESGFEQWDSMSHFDSYRKDKNIPTTMGNYEKCLLSPH